MRYPYTQRMVTEVEWGLNERVWSWGWVWCWGHFSVMHTQLVVYFVPVSIFMQAHVCMLFAYNTGTGQAVSKFPE